MEKELRSLDAVIFDCDGVLVNSEPLHYRASQNVLNPLGISFDYEYYKKRYIGFADRDAFIQLFEERKWRPEEGLIERLVQNKTESLQRIVAQGIQSFPGVVELIHSLAQKKIPMAVASGALHHEVLMFARGLGVDRFFSAIVAADDVKHSKPHPETYLKAFQRLQNERPEKKISPQYCVAIEDTVKGIQSAKDAGLYVIGVTNTHPASELYMADRVVQTLEEFPCF